MRTFFVIGLVIVCAFMAGWFTVHRTDGETTIRINRDEIKSDTRAAINRGREFLNEKVPQDGHQNYSQGQYAQGQHQFQNQVPAAPAGYRYPQSNQQPPYLNQPLNQQPTQPATNQGYYYPNDPNATRPLAPWEQAPQNRAPQGQRF